MTQQREGVLIERLRDATVALRKAQAEREALELEKVESIAIVGIGCRFPGGANDPDAYWRLLDEGRDAIQSLDPRWAWLGAKPSPETPRWAGLLDGPLDTFDPTFFGIAPREAKKMDPQQRLLLEVAWEALEDAAIAPGSLDGSATGMFLGACSTDYQRIVMREPLEEHDAYNATGNVNSVAAGRVSFTLGLQGPSITVDTACSSSLVAVHLACRSLRVRESNLALAGGVNLILSYEWMDGVARTQALSPDGRCWTFDAMANGYVRGEGCGLVVLKRLSDAVRDGDAIRAVIRGSALNQDGRSTGLTTPNVRAQEAVIREAYRNARVKADAIGFVETHGTGTSLGDPIEVEALRAVMPARADGSRCALGAVKTNLGHLEAAAGVAGLIKAALALQHERIPRNLNFRALNPRIRLDGTALQVAAESVPWPRTAQPRLAGVSSFGLSGTNAHIVLEEAPAPEARAAAPERAAELLVISAKSEGSLHAQATRLAEHLQAHAEVDLGDMAFSLAGTRSPMEYRLAVSGSSREAIRAALEAAGRGETPAGVVRGAANRAAGKPAFLFTGQGAQVLGMGRGLHQIWPAFREAFDRCAELFGPELEHPLQAVIWAEEGQDAQPGAALLDQTAYTQPALFAVEWALQALWRSWGVVPGFLAGHSIGELVAACVAGVFSLEDGVRLVAARGRAMQALPPGGAMISIAAAEAEVAEELRPHSGKVSIAAVNGPKAVVISGVQEDVEAIAATFAARGARTKRLAVSHAFHSPLMDPMLADFERIARTVTYQKPTLPLVSNLTGKLVTGEVTDPSYWVRHVREPVRFAGGVQALHEAGARTFVEVGPRSTLLGLVPACLPDTEAALVRSMRAGRDEAASVLEGVGTYWANGGVVKWSALFPAECRRVALPTYAWQRERHWVTVKPEERSVVTAEASADLFLRLDWPEVPRAAAPEQEQRVPGGWLVVGDGTGLAARMASALTARGARCAVVASAADREELQRRMVDALGTTEAWEGVLDLTGLDARFDERASAAEVGEETARATGRLMAVLGALSGAANPPRLWVVTRGACALGGALANPCQSALWGMGRVAAWEHSAFWGGLIDLDPAGDPSEVEALLAEVLSPESEDQLALRGSRRHAARLVFASPDEPASLPALEPEGTYLVTGGLDGPVLPVARWLVERGARSVIVTRSPGGDAGPAAEAIASLESQGVRVRLAEVDVTRIEDMEALLAGLEQPLRGVIHAAGLGPVRALGETDDSVLQEALRPKVMEGWALHRLLQGRSLDFFILFSSGAGVWGSAGHGAGAAADAFLDGLAHLRRARALPGLSVDWGIWSDGGAGNEAEARLREAGALPLSTAQAFSALGRILGSRDAQCVVARMDWPRFSAIYAARSGRPLLSGLAQEPDEPPATSEPRRWKGQSAEEIRPALTTTVRGTIASVLGFADPSMLNPAQGFAEQGLDSLMAVQIRKRLQAELGVTLSATIAFDHPNVERLVAHLLTDVLDLEDRRVESTARTVALDEPIAIVGASCRLPGGGDDLEGYWNLLAQGGIAACEVPSVRWDPAVWYDPNPDAPNRTYVTKGGFLKEVENFDPTVFRISPREAMSLDPQQRLLLEVSWEALERAGRDPSGLRETATGVFVGVGMNEYIERVKEGGELDTYVTTGNALSVIAGRISFVLGLQGPSLAVDTACSSSLVALHLACQSLRQGECDMALAGGVNVLLSPSSFVAMSRIRALSSDGRCKSFSAAADGYGRGEGCGVVVLKRLSQAQRDGDRVLAVIRGTAINHDGPSSGLTVPSGPAQQAVIRQALAQAGAKPGEVDLIECHGTGTPLGDPIEVQALAAVYGKDRPAGRPLIIGSAKANLGHLEPAAGIAGLIKVVLALQNEAIPCQPGLGELNPNIPWKDIPLTIPREPISWPRNGRPRLAGVSSFGISGTNAHVVLAEAPAAEVRASAPDHAAELVVLSGKSDAAVNAQAARLAQRLEGHTGFGLADLANGLATTRSAMERRLAIPAGSQAELREALEAAAKGETPGGAARGAAGQAGVGKVVFVFPGQGSQWLGMGRQLLEEEPAFRSALEACDKAIQAEAGFSVIAELRAEEKASQLGRIDIVQPVLFAVEVALAALWQAWGVKPDAVVGHSMGEVAAAQVAGALSLEDAAAIICRRSKLLRRISGQGEMAMVELTVEEAGKALAGYEDKLSVAVSNSPRFTVLSGEPKALAEVLGALEKKGVFQRRVKVDVASHSPQVEPLRGELLEMLKGLTPKAVVVPMRSTVTCQGVAGPELSAEYWAENVRRPVMFAPVVKGLMAEGHTVYVEMSPHPLLQPSLVEVLKAEKKDGVAIGSLRRSQPERQTLLEGLGTLWVNGFSVAWEKQFPAGGRRVDLPTYAWQRERYWIEGGLSPAGDTKRGHIGAYELLGACQSIAAQTGMRVWETTLGLERLSWLGDHRVQGTVVLPGAAYLEMGLVAGAEVFGDAPFEVKELSMVQVLALPNDAAVPVQLVGTDEQAGRIRFQVASRATGQSWQTHARGVLRQIAAAEVQKVDLEALRLRMTEALPPAGIYDTLSKAGMMYGPAFQGLVELWHGQGEALGRVKLPDVAGSVKACRLHPALLDSCFHVMAGVYAGDSGESRPWLPVEVGSLRLLQPQVGEVYCWAKPAAQKQESPNRRSVDLVITDTTGAVVAELSGLVVQQLAESEQRREEDDWFLEVDWESATVPPAKISGGRWLVVGAEGGAGSAIRDALQGRGEAVFHLGRSDLDADGIKAALAQAFDGQAPTAVVHLGSLEAGDALSAGAVEAALVHGCDNVVALVQALASMGYRDPPRLWLVTRGAQAVRGTDVHASQTPLLGLGRVIVLEQTDLRCARVDLDPAAPSGEVEALLAELLADDAEEEIALRAGERWVSRLDRRVPDGQRRERIEPAGDRPYHLEIDKPGVLEHLVLRACERRSPKRGEVEIAVQAAGLNFADVMQAMGFVFGADGGPIPLGAECAGQVVAVGEGVESFRVGQEVVAFAPFSFATHVTIHEVLVAPRPMALSHAQAASLPVVLMTAWYALERVARLRAGERVLIHSATGGTGQAAMQVARHLGAEIFATAGSPEKRAMLRAQGVEHVMDSRTLDFSEQVLAATGGQGVDVVFNSLSGAAIDASLAALAPDGRFVEIGKRDIYADRPLGLGHFKKSITYSHVDLAGLTMRRPEVVSKLLREVMELVDRGVLQPLPVETFPISRAADAFFKMAQARHTGKLALTIDDPSASIRVPVEVAPTVRPDGAYLITGGLGGLGLTVARWLAEQGARQLVLTGRSGASSPEQKEAIAALSAAGAQVTVVKADVADPAQVEGVLKAVAGTGAPLRGIVHAAGLLEDGLLLKQDPARFRRVMAPKVLGAVNLHLLTRDAPLDFFVMYSSAAGLMGAPGQANYAAANAFLDGLAHHRRAHGVPGLSIDWTTFSEVGLAAAQQNRGARVTSQGVRSLSPSEGITILSRLVQTDRAQVGVVPLDIRQWLEFFPAAASSRTLSRLVSAYRAGATRPTGDPEVMKRLAAATPEQKAGLIEEVLSKLVSQVLRIPPGKVAVKEPLTGLGMDSLMGLELRNRIEATLGVTVPATLLWTYPTVSALSQHLATGAGDAAPPAQAAPAEPARDFDAESDAMTQSEAARLIDAEFEVLQ
jgi:epothilone polyketide synthase D